MLNESVTNAVFVQYKGVEDESIIKIALDDDLNEDLREPAKLSERAVSEQNVPPRH